MYNIEYLILISCVEDASPGWPYHLHGGWPGQKGRRVLCGQTGHHAHVDGELWQSSQAKEAWKNHGKNMEKPWEFPWEFPWLENMTFPNVPPKWAQEH